MRTLPKREDWLADVGAAELLWSYQSVWFAHGMQPRAAAPDRGGATRLHCYTCPAAGPSGAAGRRPARPNGELRRHPYGWHV